MPPNPKWNQVGPPRAQPDFHTAPIHANTEVVFQPSFRVREPQPNFSLGLEGNDQHVSGNRGLESILGIPRQEQCGQKCGPEFLNYRDFGRHQKHPQSVRISQNVRVFGRPDRPDRPDQAPVRHQVAQRDFPAHLRQQHQSLDAKSNFPIADFPGLYQPRTQRWPDLEPQANLSTPEQQGVKEGDLQLVHGKSQHRRADHLDSRISIERRQPKQPVELVESTQVYGRQQQHEQNIEERDINSKGPDLHQRQDLRPNIVQSSKSQQKISLCCQSKMNSTPLARESVELGSGRPQEEESQESAEMKNLQARSGPVRHEQHSRELSNFNEHNVDSRQKKRVERAGMKYAHSRQEQGPWKNLEMRDKYVRPMQQNGKELPDMKTVHRGPQWQKEKEHAEIDRLSGRLPSQSFEDFESNSHDNKLHKQQLGRSEPKNSASEHLRRRQQQQQCRDGAEGKADIYGYARQQEREHVEPKTILKTVNNCEPQQPCMTPAAQPNVLTDAAELKFLVGNPPNVRLEVDEKGCQDEPDAMHHPGSTLLPIRYAPLSIRRTIVVSVDASIMSGSMKLLTFQPFSQPSFAHLSGSALFTIAVNRALAGTGADTFDSKRLAPSKLIRALVDKIYADLLVSMDNVKSYLESRFYAGIKPKLCLRLGTMIFHNRFDRFNLSEHSPFDAKSLEKSLLGDRGLQCSVLKTFDTGVSEECYRAIRSQLLTQSSNMPVNKEKFVIQVVDYLHPQVTLLCICKRKIEGDCRRLTLWKVRSDPLRHMVADLACMEKQLDLRLILTTKEVFKGNLQKLQTLIDNAEYDIKADGDIRWPAGTSSSGSYSVIRVTHMCQINFNCSGQKWKLRHVSRKDLQLPKVRFSYEIDVTIDQWSEQYKIWKEGYTKQGGNGKEGGKELDLIFKPLSGLLKWIWTSGFFSLQN